MKKITALFITAALVLGLCACDGIGGSINSNGATTGLQVGYGRELIMPETEIPMGGYGNSEERISTGFMNYLYGTCIAMTEGEETVLLFSQDLVRSYEPWTQAVREKITAELGIPGDRIMLSATHTHSGPENTSSDLRVVQYQELYVDAMLNAAKAALADRAPATLYGAKTETENMTFVRHYLLSDGSYLGDNFGSMAGNTIVDYATKADTEMQLVKFDRDGDKQDILLMNFQAHPCKIGSSANTLLSADFIGSTRDAFEKETDMLFVYFTGATGNQNPTSRMSQSNTMDLQTYGQTLAQYAIDALPGMTKLEGEGIKATQVQFEYAMNHRNEDKLTEAKEIVSLKKAGGDPTALIEQYGLSSYSEASNVIQRAKRPATGTMELNAFYVAGMAFITAPYEMFSDNGLYIKENSPFEMTVLCTNANSWNSYCATEAAYDYMSYESSSGHFAKGCAEACQDQFIEMLNSLK